MAKHFSALGARTGRALQNGLTRSNLKANLSAFGERPRACARAARPLGLWRGRESGFLDVADFAGVHLREAEALAAEILV